MSTFLKVVGIGVVAFAVIAATIALANMETVDAGYVGVYQDKPYFFGKGGVRNEVVVGPERVYTWPSTTVRVVKIAPQTVTVHAEDFMTADRVPLDFDMAITLRVTDPRLSPSLIRKFGTVSLETFRMLVLQQTEGSKTSGELMSYFRDQVRHHHSAVFIAAQNEDGTLSNSAATVEQETRKHINAFLDRSGAGMIQVENIALGRANPPEGVRRTIEATAQQAQEVKTQAERTRAANARENAERATATADMAYVNAMGLSTDQFVELQRLKVWGEVCKTNTCIFAPGNVPIALSAGSQGGSALPAKAAAAK